MPSNVCTEQESGASPASQGRSKLQEHINEKDQIDEEAHDKERVNMQLKQTHLNGRDPALAVNLAIQKSAKGNH